MASGEHNPFILTGDECARGLICNFKISRDALIVLVNESVCYSIFEDIANRVVDINDGYMAVKLAFSDLQSWYSHADPILIDDLNIQVNELHKKAMAKLRELNTVCEYSFRNSFSELSRVHSVSLAAELSHSLSQRCNWGIEESRLVQLSLLHCELQCCMLRGSQGYR